MPDPNTRQLDWMDNAENMRPLRGGRPAAAVLASTNIQITVDEAKIKFEEEFNKADSTDDPLDVMIKYVKWFQWSFPSGRVDVLQPMVYKILTKYGTDPRYINDERTMKLWLTLADNFPERGFAVMDLACSRGSCRELAKFYIFWSKMYEYAENFTKARDILQKGINNGGAPITDLHEASDLLEVRILRWTIEKEKKQHELDMNEDSFIEHIERQPFNELDQIEHDNGAISAPILRTISYPPPSNVAKNQEKKGDFEIFADYDEKEDEQLNQQIQPTKKIFEELSLDPDYQSIFGYKEFPTKHIDITQHFNASAGIPGLNTLEQPLSGFVVYCEKEKTQKLKLKFAVKRELVENISIEENYLSRIQFLKNSSGDS